LALEQLARDLGISRSQVIDEALALFIKAVLEARKGRRLASFSSEGAQPLCEVVTPSLAQLEWIGHRHSLDLSRDAVEAIGEMVENPPKPNKRLKKLLSQAGE